MTPPPGGSRALQAPAKRRRCRRPAENGDLVVRLGQVPDHLAVPDVTLQPLIQEISPMASPARPPPSSLDLLPPSPPMPTPSNGITAHRGHSADFPENSLPASGASTPIARGGGCRSAAVVPFPRLGTRLHGDVLQLP